jgi:hypothetical protein
MVGVVNDSLTANGQALIFLGLVLGVPTLYFGQRKFEPPGRNAQHGRWLAAHWSGPVCVGMFALGVTLLVVAHV